MQPLKRPGNDKRRRADQRRRRSGFVFLLVVGGLAVFVVAFLFVLRIALTYVVRQQLEEAVKAGAVAGAKEWSRNGSTTSSVRTRARDVAEANTLMLGSVTVPLNENLGNAFGNLDVNAEGIVLGIASGEPTSLEFQTNQANNPAFAAGTGEFAAPVTTLLGGSPTNLTRAIAAGDFDNDNVTDVVIAIRSTNEVRVFLGDGAGAFALSATLSAPGQPQTPAVADFDGDGNLDFVVTRLTDDDVTCFRGNGDGTSTDFGYSLPTSVYPSPTSVAIGDFDNDTNPDFVLVAADNDQVQVFLGIGNGQFNAALNVPPTVSNNPATGVPFAITVADFDQDGNDDWAVTNRTENQVHVYLGNGLPVNQLAFAPAASSPYNVGASPRSIATGDFETAGGAPDLITGNFTDGTVTRLQNALPAGFNRTDISVGGPGANTRGVDVADFNGDGDQDWVAVNQALNTRRVFLGDGAGGFSPAPVIAHINGPMSVVAVDVDGRFGADFISVEQFDPPLDRQFSTFLNLGAGDRAVRLKRTVSFNLFDDVFGLNLPPVSVSVEATARVRKGDEARAVRVDVFTP